MSDPSEPCGQVQMESAAEVVVEAAPTEGHQTSHGKAESTVTQVAGLVQAQREHLRCTREKRYQQNILSRRGWETRRYHAKFFLEEEVAG